MKRGTGLIASVAASLLLTPALAGAATITPTVKTDDFGSNAGNCSLREAVQSAVTNAAFGGCPAGDGGTDTIPLTGNIINPYNLTVGGNDEDGNEEGDIDIGGGGPIVIAGQGADMPLVDQDSPDRVFDVKNGASVTLQHLIVTDGDVNSVVGTNDDLRGGNIRAQGTNQLTINDVLVDGGKSTEGGGGIYAAGDTSLVVNDSRIIDNTDQNTGGGILILGIPSAQINRTTVDGNSLETTLVGGLSGGGIRATVDNGGVLTIADSTIANNFIVHDGGSAADQAFGGGLSINSQGTIQRSLIQNNSVQANFGSNPERGGGLSVDGGDAGETLSVVNTTFHDNNAGGASDDGQGGAVYVNGNVGVNLAHDTLVSNSATESGAADQIQRGATGTGPVSFSASILSGFLFTNVCEGSLISSGGYNVLEAVDAECGLSSSDDASGPLGLSPGPPADNGGFTKTFALAAGSRAIDFVPASACQANSQDQRGFFRPSGPGCDAGAYERVTCNGVVQEGPGAVDCPPAPPAAPASPCTGLKGKKRKRCLCKQKKSKKKRKKCLKKLKAKSRPKGRTA